MIQWYLSYGIFLMVSFLWYLARPRIISGQDARTTRNFGIFFKLEVSKLNLLLLKN